MGSFVDHYYSVEKFQAAYAGIIPNITDRNQWPEVDKGFMLYPPTQKKREAGKLRKNRFKSARETGGKATRQVKCPNCKENGHRAGSWKCSLTGTKKRKRTKKSNAQVGRKKANKAAAGDEAVTPRTRRALAREAAAKARREAQEAELKADAARQVAEVAAREEIDATQALDVIALEVQLPETAIQPSTAKRSLFTEDALEVQVQPPRNMTPKKKQVATKIKKKTGQSKTTA